MLRRSLVSTLAGVALLTACGDSTGPGGRIAGTYQLETINGDPLPVTIFEFGPYRAEALSGDLVVRANNTFSTSLTLRETDAGGVMTTTITCTGTYTVDGNTVTFREQGSTNVDCAGGEYVATWNENTITVVDAAFGVEAVYRR
jgi:hypothetical protein